MLIYFFRCKQTLELSRIPLKPYSGTKRERKFSRRLFTSSIKREINHFPIVVVHWRRRNVQKSVMHVQSSCCFANLNLLLFWRSRCRRRRGILKSLIITRHAQSSFWFLVFCYFGRLRYKMDTVNYWPRLTHKELRVSIVLGSFSINEGDSNENGKNAIGLISTATTLHVHHTFVHFFAFTERLRRENA